MAKVKDIEKYKELKIDMLALILDLNKIVSLEKVESIFYEQLSKVRANK